MTESSESSRATVLERLDRTEANLETVSRMLLRVSNVVESNRGDIDQLSERIGQLAQQVSELRHSQTETKFALDRLIDTMVRFQEERGEDRATVEKLAESQENTQETVNQLAQLMVQSIESANADRLMMQQILQYLRNQFPGNGARGNEGEQS